MTSWMVIALPLIRPLLPPLSLPCLAPFFLFLFLTPLRLTGCLSSPRGTDPQPQPTLAPGQLASSSSAPEPAPLSSPPLCECPPLQARGCLPRCSTWFCLKVSAFTLFFAAVYLHGRCFEGNCSSRPAPGLWSPMSNRLLKRSTMRT
jgi:hypothetical protein